MLRWDVDLVSDVDLSALLVYIDFANRIVRPICPLFPLDTLENLLLARRFSELVDIGLFDLAACVRLLQELGDTLSFRRTRARVIRRGPPELLRLTTRQNVGPVVCQFLQIQRNGKIPNPPMPRQIGLDLDCRETKVLADERYVSLSSKSVVMSCSSCSPSSGAAKDFFRPSQVSSPRRYGA